MAHVVDVSDKARMQRYELRKSQIRDDLGFVNREQALDGLELQQDGSSRSRRISRRFCASFFARMLDIGMAMPPLRAKKLAQTRRELLGPGN